MVKVNDEVVRIKGSKGNLGDRGTVVEVGPAPTDWVGAIQPNTGRVRVYWHTYAYPGAKSKRTWIDQKAVQVLQPVKQLEPVHGLLFVDEDGNYSGPFVGN